MIDEMGIFPLSLFLRRFIIFLAHGSDVTWSEAREKQASLSCQAPAIREEKIEKKGENLKNGRSVRKMPKSKSVHLFQDETEPKVPLGENNMT